MNDELLFPDFANDREYYEKKLNQKAKVIWFTGLSASGKSTIAKSLYENLKKKGFIVRYLDGDNVRKGVNNNLGFSEEDRKENIRRIAEVSRLFNECGIITINSFISPTIEIRQLARSIIGNENFIEVYVNTPLEICEERDKKGLYAKARKGEIKDFTGISAPYEPPENPDIELKTLNITYKENVSEVLDFIMPIIRY
jgi:adenylylsulfate kinase